MASHSFTPVAIESLGPMEGKTLAFLKELSQRVQQRTGEGGLMPTFCNTSLSPSREEVHYLWLGGLWGTFWVRTHFMYSVVLLHQQPLLFSCLVLFVLLSYLCFCFIYYLN